MEMESEEYGDNYDQESQVSDGEDETIEEKTVEMIEEETVQKGKETKKKKPKEEEKWRIKNFAPKRKAWLSNNSKDILEDINSPYEYIPEYFYEVVADETNLYSVRNTTKNINTSKNEIKDLFAMYIIMGILKFPRLRQYWQTLTFISTIFETMTRNRFTNLRNNLHLVNNKPDNNNRIWKVRPIVDLFTNRSRMLELKQNTCIDEQMIPFKGKINIKQYIKNKPSPWGIKCYLLYGASGMVYDLIAYQGKTISLDPETSEVFGITGAITLTLANRIPADRIFNLYADIFFTSIPIIKLLTEKKIWFAGTIRENRIQSCPFTLKNKDPHGSIKKLSIYMKISS
ncbi:hypothetical protein NQ314_006036 [Rhamnusium bicolor]|uniref:PiggyBac transposable element-derived protein domain-containing protein n=1 Tax=Rhamnusium bicolor TaxID=1586634 RepID=A0AAV8Z9J6_9CUCU|nr:hypothetical protein NQ314_006036 [Rhamnusium bicolor]